MFYFWQTVKDNSLCVPPSVLLGVYLPLLWEQSFCWKSPIALGYTRGHFSALVAMENDGFDNRGAGANLNTDDDETVTFLPLVDSERKLLHIHFLSAQEVRSSTTKPVVLLMWGRLWAPHINNWCLAKVFDPLNFSTFCCSAVTTL
ncbi:Ubiquitin thioesterase Zranb1 [Xenoophorus captivus]|uniref:ubiquitinyl hydrolase 1 n=1 Tax=Xenoophorus captivus TaxID=1517983 RepID=A0ABV0QIJ8_9TELE